MNIEAAVSIQGVRGPKMVRGSAAGNVGELEHHVAPEKSAFSNPAEQKKSHWTVPAPALRSPLMQPSVKAPQESSPSPGTESSNPARSGAESAKNLEARRRA